MSHGDPRKWQMPGWRIEQGYSPGVLIGNWGEQRYTVSFAFTQLISFKFSAI